MVFSLTLRSSAEPPVVLAALAALAQHTRDCRTAGHAPAGDRSGDGHLVASLAGRRFIWRYRSRWHDPVPVVLRGEVVAGAGGGSELRGVCRRQRRGGPLTALICVALAAWLWGAGGSGALWLVAVAALIAGSDQVRNLALDAQHPESRYLVDRLHQVLAATKSAPRADAAG